MPSSYTTNLGIEKPATGEQSGTWGDTVNLNYDLFDQAINGVQSVTLPAAGSSGSPKVLAITDGTVSEGRNKFIEFVDGGDLGATAYVQLTPNDAEKVVHIRNSLSANRSVIVFQGTYNASNDFEIPNGKDVVLKFDGAGSGAVVEDVFVDLQVTGLTAGTADINGGTLDGVVIGGASAAAATVTDLTASGTVDFSGATVSDLGTVTTADIDGGTIDGVTVGGSTPAAGTFTTLTASGDVTVDTDTFFVDVSTDRVGIGTASPTTPAHVAGSSGGSPLATIETTDSWDVSHDENLLTILGGAAAASNGGGKFGVKLRDSANSTKAVGLYAVSENTFSNLVGFALYTGTDSVFTEKVRVAAGGNVGIGTDSPAGKMEIIDASNQGLVLRSSQSASADTQSRLYGGAYSGSFSTIAFMNANATGNNLSIGGGTAAAEPATRIDFFTGAVGSTGAGTRAMRIDSLGRVGINTSSPARPLHVDDVMRLEPRAAAPGNASAGDIFFNSSTNKLQCYDGSVWQDCF